VFDSLYFLWLGLGSSVGCFWVCVAGVRCGEEKEKENIYFIIFYKGFFSSIFDS
jgi:hypothetical protein